MEIMKQTLLFFLLIAGWEITAQQVPTFEDIISLRSAGGVTLSADGKNVAFTVEVER